MRRLRRWSWAGFLLLLATAACSKRTPAPRPVAAKAPVDSYELRLGKGIYRHYCQTCHGETGAGDGFNAFNLDPRPHDLSDPAFQKKKSDAELADAIRRGGAGVGLSALMPPWGHTLSARQIDEVILSVRALRKGSGPEPPAGGSSGAPGETLEAGELAGGAQHYPEMDSVAARPGRPACRFPRASPSGGSLPPNGA